MIHLLSALLQPAWHPVDLGEGQSFEVRIRPAVWGDLIRDEATLIAEMQRRVPEGSSESERVKHLVMDWRGVVDNAGDPVPYTFERLQLLCSQHPRTFLKILTLVRQQFVSGVPAGDVGDRTGGESKNSDGPSTAGSVAAPLPMTPASDSGSAFDPAPLPPAN